MNWLRWPLRKAFLCAAWPLRYQFDQALRCPAHAQQRVRNRLARLARDSAYGRHYGLKKASEFRESLPVVDYDALAPWLERAVSGEHGVLTPEKINLWEATSGSSGMKKLVPYPRALRRVFTRMAVLWLADLLRALPALGRGRFYFSVSPRWGERQNLNEDQRVGLDSDAEYLGPWLQYFLAPFVVKLENVNGFPDVRSFQNALCHALLSARELEAISVWNPSFLSVLLDRIEAQREQLINDVTLPEAVRRGLRADPIDWREIWPALQLVSCWADAQAELRAAELRRRLPGVHLQPKGLLATEAPLTVPLEGVPGSVPLVTDIYFEFENAAGDLLELCEIRSGESYGLIISQPGGLYRYRLGDHVRVVGWHHATPTLQLEGRGALVSDLVGEKLSDAFLRQHVVPLLPGTARVATFLPVRHPEDAYLLLLDSCSVAADEMASQIENVLQQTHHYALARALGQLGPLLLAVHAEAEQLLIDLQVRQGLHLGDIKPALLVVRSADDILLAELDLYGAPN